MKASKVWKPAHGGALKSLIADGRLTSGHGVYGGTAELKDGPLRVWPVQKFFARLAAGDVLG